MSSHGEIRASGRSNSGLSNTRSAQSICIQVVPHFGGVLMTMSSDRNANDSQRALSNTRVRYLVTMGQSSVGVAVTPAVVFAALAIARRAAVRTAVLGARGLANRAMA